MSVEQLAQILVWPVVALVIVLFTLIYFKDSIKKFLDEAGKTILEVGPSGIKATLERKVEAAALFGAALVKSSTSSAEKPALNEEDVEKARKIANVINQEMKPNTFRRLADASVLWVDDIPSNNLYERRALEVLGIRFTDSTSTEDALEKIRLNKYDVIISDMKRLPDKQAGYTLLAERQKLGDTTPFIIYSSSNLPEHKAEALRRGAVGSTNNPQELFQLVLNVTQSE